MPSESSTINLAYLNNLEQVASYYKLGKITASPALKSLLNLSNNPTGAKLLTWLFEERAEELSNFLRDFPEDKPPFLCLFKGLNLSLLIDNFISIGKSGSGAIDVPDQDGQVIEERSDSTIFKENLREILESQFGPFTGTDEESVSRFLEAQPGDRIKISVARNGLGEIFRDRPFAGNWGSFLDSYLALLRNPIPVGFSQNISALENLRSAAPAFHVVSPPRGTHIDSLQIVHIARPGANSDENHLPSLRATFDRLYANRTYKSNPDRAYKYADNKEEYTRFFAYLSKLPISEINEHAIKSTEVVRKAADITTTYPISYVSSFYPDLSHTDDPIFWSMMRPEMAFSSQTILNLKAGDVLFINQSFKHSQEPSGVESNSTEPVFFVPTLFDLAVCTITQWLEDRDVTVLFSAARSKNNLITNVDLNDLIGQYGLPSSLPGIIVGGLKSDKSAFTSNYGNLVNCYGLPVQLADGTSFEASSAATAYVAGLVVRMQRYTKSKGHRFLTPSAVKCMLASCGDQFAITTNDDQAHPITGNLPNWDALKSAIDQTFSPEPI